VLLAAVRVGTIVVLASNPTAALIGSLAVLEVATVCRGVCSWASPLGLSTLSPRRPRCSRTRASAARAAVEALSEQFGETDPR
jgi:hypothetical protein